MKRFLLALLLAGLPLGAFAQSTGTWVRYGTDAGTAGTGVVTQSLTPGSMVTYLFTSATDSQHLDVHACPGFFVEFDPSIADASAVSTVTLWQCTRKDGDGDGTADSNACDTIDFDTTGDGLPDSNVLTGDTSTLSRGFRNLTAIFLFVEVNVTPNPDTAEVVISCPMEHN